MTWDPKWLEAEVDYSGMSVHEAVTDTQASVHRVTGKVLRMVRLGANGADALHRGCGSQVLLRGRGDHLGQHGWPEGAHVAIASSLCPIAIVVDRAVPERRAILVGDGCEQTLVTSL